MNFNILHPIKEKLDTVVHVLKIGRSLRRQFTARGILILSEKSIKRDDLTVLYFILFSSLCCYWLWKLYNMIEDSNQFIIIIKNLQSKAAQSLKPT